MLYRYDGTKCGFLTAFCRAFQDKAARLSSGSVQLALGETCEDVTADAALAERAEKRFLSFDGGCIRELERMLHSGAPDKDEVIFNYFRMIATKKRPVREMLAEDAVRKAEDCILRIRVEIDHMKGFLRFMETKSGAMYALCSPDNDIIDLLLRHFRARMPHFPFLIHDVSRAKAAIWDGAHCYFAPLGRAEIELSDDECAWQTLWRDYYKSVNIPSRERLKQMRGYLPVRYMKFMNEFFGH